MEESILVSIKKLIGVEKEYKQFDTDIIMCINSVLVAVNQLGVGPSAGFMISSDSDTWVNLLGDRKDVESVKMYIGLKVRLMFDPPSNSFLIEAMERQVKELEWRLNVQAEPAITVVEGGVVSE